ncbi:MAG: amidohydrolase family protein [Sphaerochaetaceae bacterium]|jgi:N-acetylglucosamine-6-phosphate deacetylase|nr:amidohydrolase family protein [Sphaerochaetaceae bacterium]MDX9940424.1 amidohydrolase family protein [Sphaerochaetaceae bacterium]
MIVQGIDIFKDTPVQLTVEQGKIVDRQPIPMRQGLPYLSPAFIDLQVNGYRGIDYSAPSISTAEIATLVGYLAESGTARHVPTIITNSSERICNNLAAIAKAVASDPLVAVAIPAIHVEGPFISSEDGPRGAHDRAFVRDPSMKELDAWIDASEGLLRIVTISPEREGSIDFIRHAVSRGILVAIGHTGASAEQIAQAVDAGARLSTHLGNGSHAQLPRLKNYLWEQLAEDRLTSGLIADGHHLPSSVLKVFLRAKGAQRIFLVSDVAFLGGSRPGRYTWGDIAVEVHADGHLGLADTPYLAGAGHLLDTCIPNFCASTGLPLAESIKLATDNPAGLLAPGTPVARMEVSERADLVLFRTQGGNKKLQIEQTILAGTTLYRSEEART